MVADFYYYKQLNNQEKVLYKTIYNAVLGYESEIVIKNFLCGRADIDKVHMAVINDNPHFFYYDQRHLEYVCDGMDIAVKLNYLISKVDSKKYSTIVRDKINRILHYVKPDGKSEYEKVKAIHDILSGKVQYAYDWLGCTEGMKFLYAHSILGVFCQKKSVCDGIAKAYKLLLNAVGVKCIVVSGTLKSESNGEHAWNIVKIGEKTYHVDPTNDICNSFGEYINYDYFCLTDKQISLSHTGFEGFPVCNDLSYDFFCRNDSDITNERSLKKYIKKKAVKVPCEIYVRINYAMNHNLADLINMICDKTARLLADEGYGLRFDTKYDEAQRTIRIRIAAQV